MSEQTVSRTLLKSPPELWAECSDAQSLARHLDTFAGGIRITRLEPENTVAWEGESRRGTVRLEPAGWGTRVTLTVRPGAEQKPADTAPAAVPEPDGAPARSPLRPATFLARLVRRLGAESHLATPPVEATAQAPAADEPTEAADAPTDNALAAALDSLGKAHHRPFSRA